MDSLRSPRWSGTPVEMQTRLSGERLAQGRAGLHDSYFLEAVASMIVKVIFIAVGRITCMPDCVFTAADADVRCRGW